MNATAREDADEDQGILRIEIEDWRTYHRIRNDALEPQIGERRRTRTITPELRESGDHFACSCERATKQMLSNGREVLACPPAQERRRESIHAAHRRCAPWGENRADELLWSA